MPDYEICADCGHAKIETYTCKCSDLEDEIQQLRKWQAEAQELLETISCDVFAGSVELYAVRSSNRVWIDRRDALLEQEEAE